MNCESVPRLPARMIRAGLACSESDPCVLFWRSPHDGEVKEWLKVFWEGTGEWIEVAGPHGFGQRIRFTYSVLPRNGGKALLLLCRTCDIPRRSLYGWANRGDRVSRCLWQCRECAGLRYASEGRCIPFAFRRFGGSFERTSPWDPCYKC